jgi:hypothetical protein
MPEKFRYIIFLLFLYTSVSSAQITITANADSIGMYNVYELTVNHPKSYSNNWEDVTLNATFSGPQTINISGFYYDTNVWKFRFAPPDTGKWNYVITFATPNNTYVDSGSFICIPSKTKGFLKQYKNDLFRLVYADGTLFNGIGLEDCMEDFTNNGSPIQDFGFDGGFRTATYGGSFTNLNNYMNSYGANGTGFNIYRWTTDNCSFKLYNTITTIGNTYLVNEGKYGDTLVRALRANDIRIWLTFFGPPVFSDIDGNEPDEDAAIKRYLNYVIARYGAYADIWELFNESSATDYYVNTVTAYIRSIDPYHRLISISDPRPNLQAIDIISPHWYQKESEFESDAVAYSMITNLKNYNKPIIFGEQGNSVQNWDTLSAERMRLRSWTAFFAEGILIFWNTSFAKDYKAVSANLYLGPQERGYIKALQDFTTLADTTVRPTVIKPNNPTQVRGYGLASLSLFLGYFHHFSSHTDSIKTSFSTYLRRSGTIYWIDPATGNTINTSAISYGNQTITSPLFNIDIAMRIAFVDHDPIYDESQRLKIIIYPNPSINEFSISGNFNGTVNLELYNITGKKVLVQNNVSNNQPISTSALPDGTYVYIINSTGRRAAGKLIIVK